MWSGDASRGDGLNEEPPPPHFLTAQTSVAVQQSPELAPHICPFYQHLQQNCVGAGAARRVSSRQDSLKPVQRRPAKFQIPTIVF